ncbi:MAG: helix-turn-helix domain-containing protein [Clostridia bacterium]|nr:helix-turn-helix domain-containing protein [Clostridia bacterium]
MNNQRTFYFTHCTNRIIARKETEIRVIGLGYTDFKAHHENYRRRIQPFYTIHFIVSGRGTLEINNKIFEVKENDIFAIPNSCPFRYYHDEKDPYSYAFFEFNGSLAQTYLTDCGFSLDTPVLTCPTPIQITEIIFSLFSKLYDKKQVPYYEKLSVFLQILSSLCPRDETKISIKTDFIKEIKSYIKIHCLDVNFSVSTIANEFHISYSHLSKVFKKNTNVTLISYITKQKMLHARHLLKNTNYSIYDICFMSGFNSYTHFLYTFKNLYGCTASEYRLSQKNK